MSVELAAEQLESKLKEFPWFIAVGTGTKEDGRDALYVYVKSGRYPELRSFTTGWRGYDVLVRRIGSIRPVSHEISWA
jgi:hypothetical protein